MSRWTDVGLGLESDPRIRSLHRWRVVDEATGEAITGYLRVDEACIYADRVADEMREVGHVAEMLRAHEEAQSAALDTEGWPCPGCTPGPWCDRCWMNDPEVQA